MQGSDGVGEITLYSSLGRCELGVFNLGIKGNLILFCSKLMTSKDI